MTILKTTFLLLLILLIPLIATASLTDEATPPRRKSLQRQQNLPENAGPALQNAAQMIDRWKAQFERTRAPYKGQILKDILEEAKIELNHIETGWVADYHLSSPISPQELIRDSIQKRRQPSPSSDSPEKQDLEGLKALVETAEEADLDPMANNIFKSLYEKLYQASLRRLNSEQWARGQLFLPVLSFETAQDVFAPLGSTVDGHQEKCALMHAALGDLFMAIQTIKAEIPGSEDMRMSPNTLDRYITQHTQPWSTPPETIEDAQDQQDQMEATLTESIETYHTLLKRWKTSLPLIAEVPESPTLEDETN